MSRPELARVLEAIRGQAGDGVTVADEALGKELLRAIGVETPAGRVVDSPEEAASVADELGCPVALKLVAVDMPHKTESGAVVGPLAPSAVKSRAAEMLSRLEGRLLVEEWVGGSVACFVGLSLRGALAPVITLGLGGIWVEVHRDVAHRRAPVSTAEATEMAHSLRGAALLRGGRGVDEVDVASLAQVVSTISRLALIAGLDALIGELEINPILVRPNAPPIAVDCTVVVADRELSAVAS